MTRQVVLKVKKDESTENQPEKQANVKKIKIRCERFREANWLKVNNGFMWRCRKQRKKKSPFPLQRRATNRSLGSAGANSNHDAEARLITIPLR